MNAATRLMTNRTVVVIAQLIVGVVFLVAALGKIGDARIFALQIRYFRLLPLGLENLMAIVLPWVELLAALAILLRLRPRAGSMVVAGLMGLFVAVVAAAVLRGLDIECGCFGTADAGRVGVTKLLENLLLLGLAMIGSGRPQPTSAAPVPAAVEIDPRPEDLPRGA